MEGLSRNQCQSYPSDVACREPMLLEKLEARKRDFEERLSSINQSIEYLKANPGLQNFMDCLNKSGL